MYSFLDDKDLYGAPLVNEAVAQQASLPSGAVSHPPPNQTGVRGGLRGGQSVSETRPPPAPLDAAQVIDLIHRTFAALDKKFLGLEERLLLGIQKIETRCSEVNERCSQATRSMWWMVLVAVATSVSLTLLLLRWFPARMPPAPGQTLYQSAPLIMPIQTPSAAQAGQSVLSPPTPVFVMPAPSTFLAPTQPRSTFQDLP